MAATTFFGHYVLFVLVHVGIKVAIVCVEEGLGQLATLCAEEVAIGEKAGCLPVPEPRETLQALFHACAVTPPATLPRSQAATATKRKLPSPRKKR